MPEIPTCTLGGLEFQLLGPVRKIEIVEVRSAVAAHQRHRAALTCLGRSARGLWLARDADGPLYREPRYSGDPVAYGAEVYEALSARCSADEIDNAAATAFLAWFDAAKLLPDQEKIAEHEGFTAPPAQIPSTSGGA